MARLDKSRKGHKGPGNSPRRRGGRTDNYPPRARLGPRPLSAGIKRRLFPVAGLASPTRAKSSKKPSSGLFRGLNLPPKPRPARSRLKAIGLPPAARPAQKKEPGRSARVPCRSALVRPAYLRHTPSVQVTNSSHWETLERESSLYLVSKMDSSCGGTVFIFMVVLMEMPPVVV